MARLSELGETTVSRRGFIGWSASTAASIVAAACSPAAPAAPTAATGVPPGRGPTQAAAAPKPPPRRLADTLTIANQTFPPSLDPHSNSTNAGFFVPRQVTDALVSFDDKGERLIGQLATEWRRIDPTTWEFKLRDDVKFSNGEDFTAQTVVFNVDRLFTQDPNFAQVQGRLATIGAAEAVNSTTVRIKTKTPDPLLVNRLSMLFMVPERYARGGADMNTRPVGTGSFRVTNWQVNNVLELEAWDGSWRGKSTVQKVKVVNIPEPAAMASAIRTGEVDAGVTVAPELAQAMRNDFNLTLMNNGACSVMSILGGIPQLNDRRVRQALNYAVNKEELVRSISGGFGKVAEGQLLQPGMFGYDTTIRAYPYDPERARALLREAGVTDFELRLETATTITRTAEAVAGYLKNVGITMSLQITEPLVFLQRMGTRSDANMFHWETNYWHLRDFDAAAQNFALRPQPFFPNEQFRELFLAQRSEVDETRRRDLIARAVKLMYDEAACIFLLWDEKPVVFTKKIDDIHMGYDRTLRLWKIEKAA